MGPLYCMPCRKISLTYFLFCWETKPLGLILAMALLLNVKIISLTVFKSSSGTIDAPLNKRNRLGETALMTVIIYGHLEIVELLVQLPGWHRIDYAAENKNG